MVLAFPIGWTMSQIILTTMFFGLFAPIGFAFQLLGRDTVQRRHRGELDSYWQHKPVSADFSPLFQTVLIHAYQPPTTFTIRT